MYNVETNGHTNLYLFVVYFVYFNPKLFPLVSNSEKSFAAITRFYCPCCWRKCFDIYFILHECKGVVDWSVGS